jgi:hypothetical protein
MGKSIGIKLKENQSVVTEAQYTVTLLVTFDNKVENNVKLFTRNIRATSDNEALGMIMMNFRRDNDWKNYVIGSFNVTRTGS